MASTNFTVTTSQLLVRVGGPDESSRLQSSEVEILITFGKAGYEGGNNGGVGYSGGGQAGENGGEGGNGGYGRHGGAGSGLNISFITLYQFSLTPGVGGNCGGGGGSVLVDGWGPGSYSWWDEEEEEEVDGVDGIVKAMAASFYWRSNPNTDDVNIN